MPAVQYSVVMAVYKNDRAEWFEQALESMLNQTVTSNDIVIVVDGPLTDSLNRTLRKYQDNDAISIIRLKTNQGLGNALNVGIENAKNELIARMDSDDIAVPNRIEIQLAEFAKNPKLDIVGGQIAEFIDNPDEVISYRRVPLLHADIKLFARRRSPFNHPTVMYRKSAIQKIGGYDVTAIRIEDYDLWLRALNNGVVCGNVDATLLKYRSTSDAMKRRRTVASWKSHIRARKGFYSSRYISLSDLTYGVATQTTLLLAPAFLVKLLFNKVVR